MSRASSSFSSIVSGLFPLLVWSFLLAGFMALDGERIDRLEFNDTDDFMRLAQVRDFMAHASWYDTTQSRLNPPAGTDMHWSRLPDLPVAASIALLRPMLGEHGATVVAVSAAPALLLLGTLYAVWAGVKRMSGSDAAGMATLYLLLCIPLLAKALPGKLDHHAWQLMLMALMWYSLIAAERRAGASLAYCFAGAAMAVSLWIGLETLPLLAAVYVALGLRWCQRPGEGAAAGALFSGWLVLWSIAVLPLHVPPGELLSTSCDGLALNWVVLLSLVFLSFAGLWLISGRLNGALRMTALFAAGSTVLVAALVLDLACIAGGPYREMPARLHTELLALIVEAQPAHRFLLHWPSLFLVLLGFPLMIALLAVLQHRRLREHRGASMAFALLLASLLLAAWQVRAAYLACLFAAPLAAILAQTHLKTTGIERSRLMPPLAIILLFSPLPVLVLGMVTEKLGLDSTPHAKVQLGVAEIDASAALIALESEFSAGESAVIAAPVNWGPAILARTPHAAVAAPYHRNVAGIVALFDLHAAADATLANEIIRKMSADFLIVQKSQSGGGFIQQIIAGDRPDWLRQLPMSGHPDILLFRVLPDDERPQSG